ncbi:MAG TPA: hypothetical protein VK203_23205 [Nostocaceae cyanobacterium]|nr:hypothetical protein [Nostocaceae cyanobacterium]
MNIYFLVEGDAEAKVYPFWLSYRLPQLKRVKNYEDVDKNNYYIFNAKGQPSIIHKHLPNAIQDIHANGKYDCLVMCLDAEEVTINDKKKEAYKYLTSNNIDLGNLQFVIIVQNRCFDTWCLGNRKIYPLNPQVNPLLDYTLYYNVSINCPELLGKLHFNTHAQFHKAYLREIFKANNLKHYKIPDEVKKQEFLEQIEARVQSESTHLPTFQAFIQFCNMIKPKLSD